MPIYDYKCGNCRETREYLVSSAYEIPEKCDSCGFSGTLDKLAVQGFSVGTSVPKPSNSPMSKKGRRVLVAIVSNHILQDHSNN